MEQLLHVGDRMTDKWALPDNNALCKWMGPEAFEHWTQLQDWIGASYPGVFVPDWLYGGRKRGWSLRYKKTKAFCTLQPGYGRLSAMVVLGRAEREKFEERRYFWRPQLLELYEQALTYPDGKWLIIPIVSEADRHELMALVSMKRPVLSAS